MSLTGAHTGTTITATTRNVVAVIILVALGVGAFLLAPTRGSAAAFSLLIGAALGIVFQRGRFCFYCIFKDFIKKRDSTAIYSILAALAVGGIGYAVVFGIFLPDPSVGRLPPGAHVGPVSWALAAGGLTFGLGMSLSGACVSGHLYRIGEGYGRSPFALAGTLIGFGLGFYTWNRIYLATVSSAPTPWLPESLGYGGAILVHLALIAGVGVPLLRYVKPREPREPGPVDLASIYHLVFRRRWNGLLTGSLVGVIGVLAYLRVEPLGVTAQLGSLSRTFLSNRDLLPAHLHGLDTLAGCVTMVVETIMNNGWLIVGLAAASLSMALLSGKFKPSGVSVSSASTATLGGVLMGWGAMTSLGCTVGVLLSGAQAFALSGWVFAATVFSGVWLGLRLGFDRE